MNVYSSDLQSVFGFSRRSAFASEYTWPNASGYGDITVARDPVVASVVRISIAVLTAVVIIGLIQSFGFVMPWESGNAVGSDAGSIVYLAGNDVLVSIVHGNDTDKITSLTLYFEKSGEQAKIYDVQSSIHSGQPIQIDDLALGYSGTDDVVLEAEFESGTTKVLSKTHLEFS